jgi:hypothetical protein
MCSATGMSYLEDLFLTMFHRRIIWITTSSQLFVQRRPVHRFISVSKRMTHQTHGLIHPTQGHTMFHIHLREEPHTHLMGTPKSWASSPPHRGTKHSISVSEMNHRPISWAHPTHGFSLRSTHSVCVLEDVSRSCNLTTKKHKDVEVMDCFPSRPP